MSTRGTRERIEDLLHTQFWRCLRRGARIAVEPRAWIVRRRVARAWLAALGDVPAIDERRGYGVFGPGEIAAADLALSAADEALARARPHQGALRAGRDGKFGIVLELASDALLARDPRFVGFALENEVLGPVVRYLGEVPTLARVSLALSRDDRGAAEPAHFQRFHVDNDDLRQVKVYLHAQDVAREHGPLCFLPADTSSRVLAALAREGRPAKLASTWSDEEVFRHCDREELVVLSGPRGSGAFVDLSRCLHYGSRVGPGRERAVLVLVFLRWHRLHENPSSVISASAAHDRVGELALEQPRRHAPGTFYPDRLAELGCDSPGPAPNLGTEVRR